MILAARAAKVALLGGVAAFSALVAVSAIRGPSHPPVTVINDLDFSVAINPRCWSRSVSGADSVFLGPGEEATIHPAGACMIHSTTTSGPAGLLNVEGGYLGCLLMPSDADRADATARVSAIDRNMTWASCDEDRSGE